jgi:hypothetical protein
VPKNCWQKLNRQWPGTGGVKIEDLWMSLSEAQALQPLRAGGFALPFLLFFFIIDPAGFQLGERRTLNIQSMVFVIC